MAFARFCFYKNNKKTIDRLCVRASNLGEQSKDSNSRLYQDEFTRNIVRDGVKLIKERERTGMTLTDFANHAISILAGLSLWHVFALRAYTSDSFRLFTVPMRARVKPHPLMFTMYFLDEALKRLSTVEAKLRPQKLFLVAHVLAMTTPLFIYCQQLGF
jgi:hypothetical protein